MNWYTPCAYNDAQKAQLSLTGRKRLKALADALGFESSSYDLRSNRGGVAVSAKSRFTTIASMSRSPSPQPAGTAASSSAPAKDARTTPEGAITSRRSHGSTISRNWRIAAAPCSKEPAHETPHQRTARRSSSPMAASKRKSKAPKPRKISGPSSNFSIRRAPQPGL